jgi:hypothetical protein
MYIAREARSQKRANRLSSPPTPYRAGMSDKKLAMAFAVALCTRKVGCKASFQKYWSME